VSKRFQNAIAYGAYLVASTAVVVFAVEAGLRLFFGLPEGLFHYEPYDGSTLFLPDREMRMVMGPLPYTIQTNSHGLRGPEIPLEKPEGKTRIIALGDSVTHGFYVPNDKTYPALLERLLRERGHDVDVINIALGWASIDLQFAMLQTYGMPFDPDIVVLQFVTNDLDEIRHAPREDLLSRELGHDLPEAASEWFWFGRTALGERVLDTVMRLQYPKYRRHSRQLEASDDPEFELDRGDEFEANARHFVSYMVERQDSLLQYQEFNAEAQRVMENYIYTLEALRAFCEENGIEFVMSYHPDYAHIYQPARKSPMHRQITAACERLGVPLADQLDAFRAHEGEVLHFAPVDFHPNAAGNALIAEVIADTLESSGVLTDE